MAPVPMSRIAFSDLQAEFGGSNPIAMSEYFENASTGYTAGVSGVPTTGTMLRVSHFAGKAKGSAPLVLTAGVLDGLTAGGRAACVGAYSLRRLSSNYTGPTLAVRRSTDNATTQVYGSSNGALGLALDGTGTPLTTWLSNADAFVVTLYDQSGNRSNDATQATTTAQPMLTLASNPVAINFRTSKWLNLPNGTVPIGNSAFTVHFRHGVVDNTVGGFLGSGSYFTANATNAFRRATTGYSSYWWTNNLNAGTYAAGNKLLYGYNGTNRTLHTNGTLTASITSGARNSTALSNTLGKAQDSEMLNGDLYYMHIFNAALSSNDIAHATTHSA